jgi:hypothetical protein
MRFTCRAWKGSNYKHFRWAQRSSHSLREGTGRSPRRYANAIRAIIESAVVTWIGIVLAEIGMLAPTGGITVSTMFSDLRGVTKGSLLDESRCRICYTQYHTRILRKRLSLFPYH